MYNYVLWYVPVQRNDSSKLSLTNDKYQDNTKGFNKSGKAAHYKGTREANNSFVRQYERKRTVGRSRRRWKDEKRLLRILDNQDNRIRSG
jgi:hypothetical protein